MTPEQRILARIVALHNLRRSFRNRKDWIEILVVRMDLLMTLFYKFYTQEQEQFILFL